MNLLWGKMSDTQEWALSLTLNTKKTEDKKYQPMKAKLTSFIDLKQLKAMFLFNSDVAAFKAFSDGKQSLLMSRDVWQYCVLKNDITEPLKKLKALKKDKEKWQELTKTLKEKVFILSGINNLKLSSTPETYEGEVCDVLTF